MSHCRELLKRAKTLLIRPYSDKAEFKIAQKLIFEIEKELAKPETKPVACASCVGTRVYMLPQPKPLSEKEILKIINDIDEVEVLHYWEREAINRGIKLGEKAHNIGN